MFDLRDVSVRFGSTDAVRGVTLAVHPGRTTVLLGPSGCGKSTILRACLGLVPLAGGTILFDGAPLAASARRRMGYVIQDGGLFPHLTASGNVTLMARHERWSRDRIAGRLGELTSLVRLSPELMQRYPSELSGGQRQRVGLMRALMLDPDVLLLDEPLGALDPMIRFDLQTDMKRIVQSLGKTVVLVTHDLAEAGFLGDDIVLLREGAIVQAGSFAELATAPRDPFVTAFVNAQRSPLESLVTSAR